MIWTPEKETRKEAEMDTKTILVIEDNEINLKLVRSLLHIGNFKVLEAVDAETGIKIARKEQPDLILMDIQLPGMDGLEATSTLKKDPITGHIPIIAITSYAMDGDKKKAKEVGCDWYISKPINTRTFLDEIKKFLEKS